MALTENFKPSFFFLLSLLGLLSHTSALALPQPPRYAVNNVTSIPRATDGSLTTREVNLNRRDSTRCSDLSIEQAQKMPGWAKLEQYAKDTWGDGGWNIVTNPTDFPDRWASACIDDGPIQITPKGDPQCNTRTDDLKGTTDGTTGTTSVAVTTGQTTTGSWTLTQTSEFGTSATFGASFEIPDIFDLSTSFTAETTFTNSRSDSFSTATNNQVQSQVTGNTPDGSTCDVQVQVKSCNQDGSGRIRVAATGFVWFNYEDKRAPKADPDGGEHYKYSAKIDDVLSLDERTSWMEFDGAMGGESRGTYKLTCTKTGA